MLDKLQKNDRSEEVSDIIERMPISFGRWVMFIVIFLVIMGIFSLTRGYYTPWLYSLFFNENTNTSSQNNSNAGTSTPTKQNTNNSNLPYFNHIYVK